MLFPDHPRPDFRRLRWISLEGRWGFIFDDEGKLSAERASEGDSCDMEILVPYPYQSRLSGIGVEDEHDTVWYMREFRLEDEFLSAGRALLHFGAVDYEAKVWLNGKYLGSHVGGYDPFVFDVTGILSYENRLVVRVVDRHLDQPRGKQAMKGREPEGAVYSRITGIWQPVWLEFIQGECYIRKLRLLPGTDGSVNLDVKIGGKVPRACKVEAVFSYLGCELERIGGEAKGGSLELRAVLGEVHPWNVGEPELYDVRLRLTEGGNVLDEIESYFGIREVSCRSGRIVINGEPVYLQMTLEQGYYHDGLYTPSSPRRFYEDLRAVVETGFNGVRAHQKPPDPRYLYFADSLGVVVWEEMGDWGMSLVKENQETFWKQWRGIVERDLNHPSIIAWTPFNERLEVSRSREAAVFVDEIVRRTRRIDGTRLIVDNSGFTHTKTDILDIHDYRSTTLTGRMLLKRLRGREYWRPLVEGTEFLGIAGLVVALEGAYSGQPIVISEFGGWGIRGQRPIVGRKPWAYAYVKDSFQIERKYRDVVSAFAKVEKIAGYCYTQLYDVEGELNGLLTYDRRWKVDPEKIREANRKARHAWLAGG